VNTPPLHLPTLFLIGDSTVRNGQGNGARNQWGWGDLIAAYFHPAKIRVLNRAQGGRSSRTFISEGLWDAVLQELQPGDYVLIQFGHNDATPLDSKDRPRGTIPSIGEETLQVENPITHVVETVHTYGWYMRQYIAETKAKGATPIVLSPVPRKRWTDDGKTVRNLDNYTTLSQAVAESQGVPFIDLNAIVADQYDRMGHKKVDALFPNDNTHTNWDGAEINAASVVAGLKGLKDVGLANFLMPK
jgi:lysophospholipase L1-like esterase